MVFLKEREIKTFDVDAKSLRVFLKVLDLIGGPRKLIEYRNLTWLPSLIQATYAVVMAKDAGKTEDEIAQFLGLTRQTVRNILRADPEVVKKRLKEEVREKTLKDHVAGGLAKWAYDEIIRGNEQIPFLAEILEEASQALGVTWPIEILRKLKGVRFPMRREELLEIIGSTVIKGIPVEELLLEGPETVKNPAQLLHILHQSLQRKEAMGDDR